MDIYIKRILKYIPVKMAKTKIQLLYSDSLFDALNFSLFGEKENNQWFKYYQQMSSTGFSNFAQISLNNKKVFPLVACHTNLQSSSNRHRNAFLKCIRDMPMH